MSPSMEEATAGSFVRHLFDQVMAHEGETFEISKQDLAGILAEMMEQRTRIYESEATIRELAYLADRASAGQKENL